MDAHEVPLMVQSVASTPQGSRLISGLSEHLPAPHGAAGRCNFHPRHSGLPPDGCGGRDLGGVHGAGQELSDWSCNFCLFVSSTKMGLTSIIAILNPTKIDVN